MQKLMALFGGLTGRRAIFATFLTGALMALGHAPWGLWPLTLVGFVVLAMLLEAADTPRTALWRGWGAGGGYFAVSLSWIVEPFFVDIARHGWMAPFAIFLMAGGLAIFWAVSFWGARKLAGQKRAALALCVTLPLAELLRAYVFTGFPWAMPAYIWVDLAPMQLVSLIGPHGLNVLTVLMTAGVWGASGISRNAAFVLGVAVWGVAPVVSGYLTWDAVPVSDERPLIRLLQPNAPQHLKWDPEWVSVFYDRNLAFTADPGAQGRPDLIVWPETSVPVRLSEEEYGMQLLRDAANGVPVLFGIGHARDEGFYNSIVHMNAEGGLDQSYDKRHLVPFGEYVPFGDVMAQFGIYGLAANQRYGFTAGAEAKLFDLGPLGQALPLICYEAVFPQDVNAAPDGADWILQITNDAWFGQISGPWQHLVQAQFRAVEQGKPLVRVANTGVTAMIDPYGTITAQLPFATEGFLDAYLPEARSETLYRSTGDRPVFLFLLFFGCVLIFLRQLRAKHG
ncbi:apolipoprotein N-acyltransferase [Halocynthiibacter styelae]|uniref:Apolipoprotein N-acyltransferase n=1 Tax=Halocynthiibacter styelae TaxID=2761955 RepID=A0A8J7IJI7_9RHOB|nr:apolipoprotein N-acyltransferase [Paenihalocynthiibacter styelae]MBI1494273.1 apolipoprotein N-acyltransferase [Paenihalocynthiibacter styelae]